MPDFHPALSYLVQPSAKLVPLIKAVSKYLSEWQSSEGIEDTFELSFNEWVEIGQVQARAFQAEDPTLSGTGGLNKC